MVDTKEIKKALHRNGKSVKRITSDFNESITEIKKAQKNIKKALS